MTELAMQIIPTHRGAFAINDFCTLLKVSQELRDALWRIEPRVHSDDYIANGLLETGEKNALIFDPADKAVELNVFCRLLHSFHPLDCVVA